MDLNDNLLKGDKLDLTDFDMDKIVNEVILLGVSYAGELSRRTMIHREKVLMIMHQLVIMGRLDVLVMPPYDVPWQIQRRLSYFHAMGLTHNWQFIQRQWVVIPNQAIPQEFIVEEVVENA